MMNVNFLSCLVAVLVVYSRYTESKDVPVRAVDLDRIKERSHVTAEDNGACSCSGLMCGCCQRITYKKLHLNDVFCANISYLSKDIGVRLTLSINGKIFIDEKVSAKEPPALCVGIPHLVKYGSVCLDFYNMNYSKSALSGCAKLEFKVWKVKAFSFKLGCFKMPLLEGKVHDIQLGKGKDLLYRQESMTERLRRHNNTEMTEEEKEEFLKRLGQLIKNNH